MEDNVTTKIRIVLNCSMKIGKNPSINDSCYPGVNLVANLFELLLRVRADDYLVLSDIRKAYLMIKLKSEEDKNRFTILWKKENGDLVAYRYCTIVFGLISSAFILHRVIDHHLSRYANDLCNRVLTDNKYVDNVFLTGNDQADLLELCGEVRERMEEGGFRLRSWASNSNTLNDHFVRENVDKC